MLDPVFLTVSDVERSVAFYRATLRPLNIVNRLDYDGKEKAAGRPGPEGLWYGE